MYRSMSLKVYIERLPLLAGGRLFSYREQLKKKKADTNAVFEGSLELRRVRVAKTGRVSWLWQTPLWKWFFP